MAIGFNEIPSKNYSPGVYAEVSFVRAGLGAAPRDALLVGYLRDGDTADDLTPITVLGDADSRIPRKSQLAEMIRAFRRTNTTSKIVAIGLTPPTGGTAAAGSLAVTGTATADGTLALYVAGKRIEVGVTTGDTATDVGDAIEAAILADPDIPVGAANTTGTVAVTANFKGVEGNRLSLAVDPLDTDLGVAGISVAVTQPTGGAGTPADLGDAFALVTGERFFAVVAGFSDATSLGTIIDEMARRWGATVALDGHAFAGIDGSFAAMISEADGVNSERLTLMGAATSVTPPWTFAALAAGHDARKPDPATGYSSLPMPGALAPFALAERPDKAERDLLLAAGVSTFRVDGGRVVLDRLVTTRHEDGDGNPDDSLLALTLQRTAEALRFSWIARLAKFENYKLASAADLQIPPPGSRILTPATLKAEAVAWFLEVRDGLGLVQDVDAFKAELVAEVNGADPNRLDAFLPIRVIRELVTIASAVQIR